ncbi:MAG: hypothetical protein KAR20_27780, partial [Candidatus Heimdallarchaeota archaeon]|nr:hypothetical protein [Candidatus Heimdallarchaeota archaeon]
FYYDTLLHFDTNARLTSADLTMSFYFRNDSVKDYQGRLTIRIARDFVQILEKHFSVKILQQNSRLSKLLISLDAENLELWSPETPHLYDLTVILENTETEVIAFTERIGIREINLEEARLKLNSQTYPIHGKTIGNQEFASEIYNSKASWLDTLFRLKGMGINAIRPEIGIFPPFLIEMASYVGLLVFENIPIFPQLRIYERQAFYAPFIRHVTLHPALTAYIAEVSTSLEKASYVQALEDTKKLFTNQLDPSRYFLLPEELIPPQWD